MELYIILLISCLSIVANQCLRIGEPNVCREHNGPPYCCFNHEEVNGFCLMCKVGFTSSFGAPCTPCIDPSFGYRCTNTCECVTHQRCDNVIGCLNNFDTSYSTDQHDTSSSHDITQSYPNQDVTKHITAQRKEACLSDKKKNPYFLLMGIVIFVLVLYICGSHIACVVMYKRLKNHRTTTMPENDYDEIGTVHYDAVSISPIAVDDSVASNVQSITSVIQEDNAQLQIDNLDENSEGTGSLDKSERDVDDTSNEESGSYVNELPSVEIVNEDIHPYNPLLPLPENEHPYKFCLIKSKMNDSETVETERASVEHYINLRI